MQILMPEAESAGALAAARGLRRAGHTVQTCGADPGGRCVALRGSRCPLDTGAIDLVVVVRPTATRDRLPVEDGVLCGARRQVPVVVAGATAGNPYSDIATAEDDSADVVTTVETVHGLPLTDHTVAANVALHACLAHRGVPDPRAHARVYRRNGRLMARLHFDGGRPSPEVATAAAVRVAGAVRELDPWASGLDVSVEE